VILACTVLIQITSESGNISMLCLQLINHCCFSSALQIWYKTWAEQFIARYLLIRRLRPITGNSLVYNVIRLLMELYWIGVHYQHLSGKFSHAPRWLDWRRSDLSFCKMNKNLTRCHSRPTLVSNSSRQHARVQHRRRQTLSFKI